MFDLNRTTVQAINWHAGKRAEPAKQLRFGGAVSGGLGR